MKRKRDFSKVIDIAHKALNQPTLQPSESPQDLSMNMVPSNNNHYTIDAVPGSRQNLTNVINHQHSGNSTNSGVQGHQMATIQPNSVDSKGKLITKIQKNSELE